MPSQFAWHSSQRPRHLLAGALCAILTACGASTACAAQLEGAQIHPLSTDAGAAVIDQEYGLLQAAGADSVRIDVPWQSLEWGGPGSYDPDIVNTVDGVIAGAAAHHLKVVLTFWESPCWASSAPPDLSDGCSYGWWDRGVGDYPPANDADYATAAAFVAKRWGSSLAALELWNEPNGGQFFVSGSAAAEYADLVKAAYPAIKAVAPGLPVLMTIGGTDTDFLSQLYADGVAGSYDGIGVHPYNDPRLDGLHAFRAVQVAHGDTAPLWVTELGWSSTDVGEQEQASLVDASMRSLATLPYVAAVEIYNMRDTGDDPLDLEGNFGLLNRDLSPKPAWAAFGQALSAIHPPAPSGPPQDGVPGSGADATNAQNVDGPVTSLPAGSAATPSPPGAGAGGVSPPPVGTASRPAVARSTSPRRTARGPRRTVRRRARHQRSPHTRRGRTERASAMHRTRRRA